MPDPDQTMTAALIREIGAPPTIEQVPIPARPPGHCLVRIVAAALQPVELFIASGRFYDGPPSVPYVPGLEGVGVVVESETMAPGTPVRIEVVHPGYGQDGCLAEYVVAPDGVSSASTASRSRVKSIRTDLSAEVVAAAGSSGSTAKLLIERAQAESGPLDGKCVAILGATGVVGEILTQLCRRAGAGRIVAVGRNAHRLDYLRTIGADATVNITGHDLAGLTAAISAAAEGPVDVVFDPLWGEPAAAALDAAGHGSLLINFGQSAGPRSPMSGVPLRSRGARVVGHAGARTASEDLLRTTDEILDDVAGGAVTVEHELVPLDELPDAWDRQGRSPGTKLVIVPGR